MKKRNNILALMLLIAVITTAVIAYTTISGGLYSPYEIITDVYALFVLEMNAGNTRIIIINLIILSIIQIYVLKKIPGFFGAFY